MFDAFYLENNADFLRNVADNRRRGYTANHEATFHIFMDWKKYPGRRGQFDDYRFAGYCANREHWGWWNKFAIKHIPEFKDRYNVYKAFKRSVEVTILFRRKYIVTLRGCGRQPRTDLSSLESLGLEFKKYAKALQDRQAAVQATKRKNNKSTKPRLLRRLFDDSDDGDDTVDIRSLNGRRARKESGDHGPIGKKQKPNNHNRNNNNNNNNNISVDKPRAPFRGVSSRRRRAPRRIPLRLISSRRRAPPNSTNTVNDIFKSIPSQVCLISLYFCSLPTKYISLHS